MDICEELGERGSFLTNFQSYNEYCNFIQSDSFCSCINIDSSSLSSVTLPSLHIHSFIYQSLSSSSGTQCFTKRRKRMQQLKSSVLMGKDTSSGFPIGHHHHCSVPCMVLTCCVLQVDIVIDSFWNQLILRFTDSLFRGWDDITGTVNVTYFGDNSPFTVKEVT